MALEPYPDALLEGLLDRVPATLARHDPREAMRLAFVAALQLLPPGERAMLVLCDVAGFDAREAARMLGIGTASADRALLRARCTLDARLPAPREPPPALGSPAERALLERFAGAFERADVEGLVALLADDVRLRLPPEPAAHRGRAAAQRVLERVPFARVRLVATRANGDPAFAVCLRDGRPGGLIAMTLAGERIAHLTVFRDPDVLRCFELPL